VCTCVHCSNTRLRHRAARTGVQSDVSPPFTTPLSKSRNVPLTTLHHRARGRPSREAKAQSQQYLTPSEEKGLERYTKLMSDLGIHVRIKFLPSLTFNIARQRSTTEKSIKPPGKNWPQGFQKRHPGLMSRRLKARDWQRHENNIYDKIVR
jgi:hypothetical protein